MHTHIYWMIRDDTRYAHDTDDTLRYVIRSRYGRYARYVIPAIRVRYAIRTIRDTRTIRAIRDTRTIRDTPIRDTDTRYADTRYAPERH